MINLPRLLNGNMTLQSTLHPDKTSISRNAFALSTATVNLSEGEPAVKARDWVELFDRFGSAGIFRVSRVRNTYGNQTALTLKHGFCVLGDDTVKESDGTLTGTAEQIIRQLFTKQGVTEAPKYWAFGTFAQTPVITYEYSNPKLLTAVYDVLKKVPGYDFTFDQGVFPWVFSLVKLSDADACEGRFGRNLDSCTVDVDDSALCTRVYLDDRDGYTDADTVSAWGVVSETLSVPEGADNAAVQEYVRAYLRDHREPYVSITLSGVDMSKATGESIDHFEAGRICRACLADYGATVRSRIVTVETPDVYGRPDDVRVTMANRSNTASDLLAKLRNSTNTLNDRMTATNRRVGGVGAKAEKNRLELIETSEEITDTRMRMAKAGIIIDGDISLVQLFAEQSLVEDTRKRMSYAGIDIDGDAASVEILASQKETDALGERLSTAESTLTVQAGEISSKVSKDGVISSINQTAEEIKIQASKINLSGYVTTSTFEAEMAGIENFFSGNSVINKLVTDDIMTTNLDIASNMKIFGSYSKWEEIKLYRGGSIKVSQTTTRNVYNSSGNTIGYVTVPVGWSFTPSSNGTYNFLVQS